MEQQWLTNWEFLILINLLERELRHCRDRDKENALRELVVKLQRISMGDKPFRSLQVNI
ncbi:MAG: hypothetical protein MUP81_06400 [Dehalococcoidia bacterium]|nr:hypothetical protein [Dehalococcoidia bacterium]